MNVVSNCCECVLDLKTLEPGVQPSCPNCEKPCDFFNTEVWSKGTLQLLHGKAEGWEEVSKFLLEKSAEAFVSKRDQQATYLRDLSDTLQAESDKRVGEWRTLHRVRVNYVTEVEQRDLTAYAQDYEKLKDQG